MSLDRLKLAADRLRGVDPALACWLAEAVSDLRVGVPAAEALELQPSAARVRRDAYIRRAAELVQGSDWRKAETIARWCRYLAGDCDPPPGDSEIEATLRRARACGLDLPESPKQVFRIIRSDTEPKACPSP